jgi:hypothetical protein
LAQLAGVTKHLRIASLFVSLFLQACQSVVSPPVPPSTAIRPNILVILSDDQRYDTMDYMPKTVERIFNQGVAFPSAYSTTSLCCPSRASILTGMYAHNHGVHLNPDPLEKERPLSSVCITPAITQGKSANT